MNNILLQFGTWMALLAGTALWLGAQQSGVEQDQVGTITADRLNVRGRPYGTSEILCQLEKGAQVRILERKNVAITPTMTEEWVRISLPSHATVWIQGAGLEEGKVIKSSQGFGGPGVQWPVVYQFSTGETVAVKTNDVDWVGVEPPPGSYGWISGNYVSTGASTNAPSLPTSMPASVPSAPADLSTPTAVPEP
jgi:uncharacterized protein YgiM (DUF1202 family)